MSPGPAAARFAAQNVHFSMNRLKLNAVVVPERVCSIMLDICTIIVSAMECFYLVILYRKKPCFERKKSSCLSTPVAVFLQRQIDTCGMITSMKAAERAGRAASRALKKTAPLTIN